MKDIRVHNSQNGNLASVKSVDNFYPDKQYFISVIDRIIKLTNGSLRFEASRPNYEIDDLMEKLKEILKDNSTFFVNDFEISFTCEDISDELVNVLPDMWFA